MKKKIGPFGELSFLLGTMILPIGTSLMARGNFGLSVVVVPAYLLSLKLDFLTFGMAEYCLQGVLLALFCLIMGKFKIPENPPTVNKTIRFPSDVVQRVEEAIQGKECNFSAFVIAAVRAALEDLDNE